MMSKFSLTFSKKTIFTLALSIIFFSFSDAYANELKINTADTVWLLVCSAFVMLMAPGLAFFYSGMVNSTNVVATLMHSYMKLCIISIVWILWGYSIAFGDSFNGLFGGLNFLGFSGVTGEALGGGVDVPHYIFATFQGMFAVVTAAIITGSFAERVRLGPILFFSTLWITFVYAPVAHWIWGGGWVASTFTTLDFAGGAVVHINSGVAGLVAALVLGKRIRAEKSLDVFPHNLPLTVVGAAMLWFGWFGFNAGSALAANEIAALAFLNTNAAAAAGGFGWFVLDQIRGKRPTALGIISGSVAGLVAITPAAGFVTPISALIMGFISAPLCYLAITILKPKLGYDDSLDAFGLHGVGGLWGAIATGLFATTSVNPDGIDGAFYGNMELLWGQIFASGVVIIYSAVATFIILQILRLFINIRVSEKEEKEGLDKSQHGEVGYAGLRDKIT